MSSPGQLFVEQKVIVGLLWIFSHHGVQHFRIFPNQNPPSLFAYAVKNNCRRLGCCSRRLVTEVLLLLSHHLPNVIIGHIVHQQPERQIAFANIRYLLLV